MGNKQQSVVNPKKAVCLEKFEGNVSLDIVYKILKYFKANEVKKFIKIENKVIVKTLLHSKLLNESINSHSSLLYYIFAPQEIIIKDLVKEEVYYSKKDEVENFKDCEIQRFLKLNNGNYIVLHYYKNTEARIFNVKTCKSFKVKYDKSVTSEEPKTDFDFTKLIDIKCTELQSFHLANTIESVYNNPLNRFTFYVSMSEDSKSISLFQIIEVPDGEGGGSSFSLKFLPSLELEGEKIDVELYDLRLIKYEESLDKGGLNLYFSLTLRQKDELFCLVFKAVYSKNDWIVMPCLKLTFKFPGDLLVKSGPIACIKPIDYNTKFVWICSKGNVIIETELNDKNSELRLIKSERLGSKKSKTIIESLKIMDENHIIAILSTTDLSGFLYQIAILSRKSLQLQTYVYEDLTKSMSRGFELFISENDLIIYSLEERKIYLLPRLEVISKKESNTPFNSKSIQSKGPNKIRTIDLSRSYKLIIQMGIIYYLLFNVIDAYFKI